MTEPCVKLTREGVAAAALAGGMVRPGEAIAVAGAAVKRTGRQRQAAVLGLIQSGVGKGAAAQYRQVREVEIDGVSSTGCIIVEWMRHCSFVRSFNAGGTATTGGVDGEEVHGRCWRRADGKRFDELVG